ncbi:MAG: DUF5659 domain-containing protein [bacterium]
MSNADRSINDVLLVAYLMAAGFKQKYRPFRAGNFMQFIFERTPELEEHIEKFYLRETSVDALTVLEGFRTIKAWASEVKKNKGGGRDGN